MPPTDVVDDSSSLGLFSNVLSFVSREIGTFVTTAIKGTTNEDPHPPRPSISRVKANTNNARKTRKRERECSHTQRRDKVRRVRADSEKRVASSAKMRSEGEARQLNSGSSSQRAPACRFIDEPEDDNVTSPDVPHTKIHRNFRSDARPKAASSQAVVRPAPRLSHADQPDVEEELSTSDDSCPPSPSPPRPTPQMLRRRLSVTMPGALFDRSPSIDPGTDQDWEEIRTVRFAAGVVSPPSVPKQITRPKAGNTVIEPEAGPSRISRPRSSSQIYFREPGSSLSASESPPTRNTVKGAIQRFSREDSDPSIMLPRSPHTPEKGIGKTDKGKQKDIIRSPSFSSGLTGNGKERAISHDAGDTSSEIRVRGMEQELFVARQEQQERESRQESDAREKDHDKERIKVLEEEVQRLKEELAKRLDTSFSDAPPPPPPPPPPPIPGSSGFTGCRLSNPQVDGPLALVRASLKHTAPPVERDINPAMPGAASSQKAKRTGLPTVNVGMDKMAAFLTEMKTHRLRKVSNAPDGSFSTTSDLSNRSYDRSFEPSTVSTSSKNMLPFPRRGPPEPQGDSMAKAGEKRKRIGEIAQEASKRRLTTSNPSIPSLSTSSASASTSFTAPQAPVATRSRIPVRAILAGAYRSRTASTEGDPQPRSLYPNLARTETDLTTPSLCSDNDFDPDADRSPEDRLPSTPPQTSANSPDNVSIELPQKPGPQKPRPATNDAIDADLQLQSISTGARRRRMHSPPLKSRDTSSSHDAFANRPPSSPIPALSPRKPRPPARSKVAARPRIDDSDDDDPLGMSYTVPTTDAAPPRKIAAGCKEPTSRRAPSHGSTGSGASGKRSVSSACTQARQGRRGTLDEELYRADDSFDIDVDDDGDLDSGVLAGVGSRSKSRGFLAHGGAGGAPVFMGDGYVEGAEASSDEDAPVRKEKKGRRGAQGAAKRKGKS